MRHHTRWSKALHRSGKQLSKLANRTLARRHPPSMLYPALFVAGGIAAGFALARYLAARSRSQRFASAQPTAERQEPVIVSGTTPTQSSERAPRDDEWVSERTEFFAVDTSSSPPPAAFSTDNPDIPTLYPEENAERRRQSQGGPR